MLFFRIIQHLLPTGKAWRTLTDKTLRRFFIGLGAGAPTAARSFVDDVYDDLFPAGTRQLDAWENQFGLLAAADDSLRRANVAAAWKAQGGQSPRYLQDTVRAAGFDVYLHSWWEPGTMPRIVRDPRDHTSIPLLGETQCGDGLAQCGEFSSQCDAFLANDPGYLVNRNLSPFAPPLVPSDPATWPHFLYWCSDVFGVPAFIESTRRAEFEQLILKICPAEAWLATLVSYADDFVIFTDDDDAELLDNDDAFLIDD